MFKRKTVFVVGAGASVDLGFPLGSQLLSNIAAALSYKYVEGELKGGSPEVYYEFEKLLQTPDQRSRGIVPVARALRNGLAFAPSIDNLLDAHADDPLIAKLGKLAIAQAILVCERRCPLYSARNQDFDNGNAKLHKSWLPTLGRWLNTGVPKSRVDSIFENVAFVVFNYDRCLEAFLPQFLRSYYQLSNDHADVLARTAAIFHPYGSLGGLEWQSTARSTRFGDDTRNLGPIADGIVTFSEQKTDVTELAAIQSVIAEAERIVFLGLSYGEENLKLLLPKKVVRVPHRKVFGTTYSVSPVNSRAIHATLKSRLDVPSISDIFLAPLECSDFMADHERAVLS